MPVKQKSESKETYKKRVNVESTEAQAKALQLVAKWKLVNEKKNKLSKQENELRDELYAHCKEFGLKTIVDCNNKTVAKVDQKTSNVVNMDKLKDCIKVKDILSIATVTQTALKGLMTDNDIKTILDVTYQAENVHLVK